MKEGLLHYRKAKIELLLNEPLTKEVSIIKEGVTLDEVSSGDLTTDCHFVHRADGGIDIVRGQSMVKIFDVYHDKKIDLTGIEVSGGRLNPKLCDPRV